MSIIYGRLGYLGLILTEKINFAPLWSDKVNISEKIIKPFCLGIALGLFFIVLDIIFANYNSFGMLPHPVFPTSLVASITASRI